MQEAIEVQQIDIYHAMKRGEVIAYIDNEQVLHICHLSSLSVLPRQPLTIDQVAHLCNWWWYLRRN